GSCAGENASSPLRRASKASSSDENSCEDSAVARSIQNQIVCTPAASWKSRNSHVFEFLATRSDPGGQLGGRCKDDRLVNVQVSQDSLVGFLRDGRRPVFSCRCRSCRIFRIDGCEDVRKTTAIVVLVQ